VKVGGFVLDTRDTLDRVESWAREGLIDRVTLQVTAWPHAEINRQAFPKWKQRLNPLGVAVAATKWFTGDLEADAADINALRQELHPDEWTINAEDTPDQRTTAVGRNMALIMQATKPEPVQVSYNGLAEQMGFDFRRYSQRGCEVSGQCYGPNGEQPWDGWPHPADCVRSVFRPVICWGGSPKSPAWWYRIKVGASYKWAYVVGYNGGRGQLEMRTASNVLYWADGFFDGALKFGVERTLRNASGTVVGTVEGLATYPKIGVTLSTTRPATPGQLAMLAGAAYVEGRPIVKGRIDLYTLDNATTEQVRAVAGVA
jgi:hypothetical protein